MDRLPPGFHAATFDTDAAFASAAAGGNVNPSGSSGRTQMSPCSLSEVPAGENSPSCSQFLQISKVSSVCGNVIYVGTVFSFFGGGGGQNILSLDVLHFLTFVVWHQATSDALSDNRQCKPS